MYCNTFILYGGLIMFETDPYDVHADVDTQSAEVL
ncbi:MAG: hypothetical protein PG981_000939 [Wolbachia endosymbiont of Ctenocephalides orientis wCori]|nr:MAG: hypothetical protein PG981_000939 [Wolbachia endosymbiont of Ctenocephalides orientis wCori]